MIERPLPKLVKAAIRLDNLFWYYPDGPPEIVSCDLFFFITMRRWRERR